MYARCKECGSDLPENTLSCDKCGANVESAVRPEYLSGEKEISGPKPLKPNRSKQIIIGTIVCLLLVAVSVYLILKKPLSLGKKPDNLADVDDDVEKPINTDSDQDTSKDGTNPNNSQNLGLLPVKPLKKVSYSASEIYFGDALRRDVADAYFTLEQVVVSDPDDWDERSEVILAKYSKNGKLLWEESVFGCWWPASVLEVDEKNKLVYVASYDQDVEDDTIKAYDFNGKLMFSCNPGDENSIQGIIVNENSFVVTYYAQTEEDDILYSATYSNKGVWLKKEKTYSFKCRYIGAYGSTIYVYDTKNNTIVAKDYQTSSVAKLVLKDHISSIKGLPKQFDNRLDPVGVVKDKKLHFLINTKSKTKFAIVVYDLDTGQLYWTDEIKEMSNLDLAWPYWWEFDLSGNFLVGDNEGTEFLIKVNIN